MAEWAPSPGGGRVYQFSAYTSGDGVITTSASANTKGSYETIVSSLAADIDGFDLTLSPSVLGVRDALMDIAIGAGGAEQIIVNNLHGSFSQSYELPQYWFPIHLPAGTRLSARAQATTGSSGFETFFHGYPASSDGVSGCSRVETWGAATGDSGGQQVDPGGTTGVVGAWQQIVASTAFDVKWVIVSFGNQNNSARTSMAGDLDIGIGASTAEVEVLDSIRFASHVNDDGIVPHTFGPIPLPIKAGSRVSCRCVNWSTNASPARLIDVVLYGIG